MPTETDPSSVLEQQQNEAAWRQLLVQGTLAVLLPTEDLENACLRTLVAEVFSELILGNGIGGKACDGWLLWEALTKIIQTLRPGVIAGAGGQPSSTGTDASTGEKGEMMDEGAEEENEEEDDEGDGEHELEGEGEANAAGDVKLEDSTSRLERFGLLSSVTSQAAREGGATATAASSDQPPLHKDGQHGSIATMFWQAIQYSFLAAGWLRALVMAIATAPSLPARNSMLATAGSGTDSPATAKSPAETQAIKRPILTMRVWTLAATLLDLDARMPWLSGLLSLGQWASVSGPGRVGEADGALDR